MLGCYKLILALMPVCGSQTAIISTFLLGKVTGTGWEWEKTPTGLILINILIFQS
jgi:hypothetical protein